jgi:4-amino-4-deoxy-L-arabinose transferase-like glycosyltransferase
MSAISSVTQPSRVAVRRFTASRHAVALSGILALSAFLNLYKLAQNGYANTYYAAAVRSMLLSWHNFFFASFDPGGLVSVDKPPLALWVETASAKLFGFSSASILIPEALAGIGSVGLLYLLVQRYFGRVAGLVAALALAISPVSVAINRDNNPDALFVLLLVAAAYVGARAIESGRLRTLLAAAALTGLAFEAKMLAAAIIVPGIALGYLAFTRVPWRRRIIHSALATSVLVVVSGAWIAAVQLTPAVDRPYVGSTSDNSALSLALGYNGLGRVTGQTGGTSTGGGGGGAFSGTPGWFRLINNALGDQGGWLLPLAILGGVSVLGALIVARDRRRLGTFAVIGGWFAAAAVIFSFSSGIIHTYYLSALAPATAALIGAGVVALWRDARAGGLRAGLPIAALALSGWLEVALLRRSGYDSWLQAIVVIGTAAAGVGLVALAAGVTFGIDRGRIKQSRVATVALGLAVAALFAAPAVWSSTVFKNAVSGVFPGAGPNYPSAGGGGGGGRPSGGTFGGRRGNFGGPPSGTRPSGGGFTRPGGTGTPPSGSGIRTGAGAGFGGGTNSSASITTALKYVESHGATKRFGLIVQSEQEAATAVIAGEPVASLGGFTGRETVLTNSYLARLISRHEARYFLLGGRSGVGGPGGTSNAAVSTITSICKAVSVTSSSTTRSSTGSSSGGSATLYDCAGKAEAIASAG